MLWYDIFEWCGGCEWNFFSFCFFGIYFCSSFVFLTESTFLTFEDHIRCFPIKIEQYIIHILDALRTVQCGGKGEIQCSRIYFHFIETDSNFEISLLFAFPHRCQNRNCIHTFYELYMLYSLFWHRIFSGKKSAAFFCIFRTIHTHLHFH